MSENQLTSMADIESKIKENVKVQFFNLLPDEQFQAMVEKEIKNFFEIQSNAFTISSSQGYGNHNKLTAEVSPFGLIIWKEVSEIAKKQLGELFSSPEFLEKTMLTPIQKEDLESTTLNNQQILALSMSSNMFRHVIEQTLEMAKLDITSRFPQLQPQY